MAIGFPDRLFKLDRKQEMPARLIVNFMLKSHCEAIIVWIGYRWWSMELEPSGCDGSS